MTTNYQSQRHAGYESPSSKIWSLYSRSIICTSGNLDDYTVDDFDWEGMGNE